MRDKYGNKKFMRLGAGYEEERSQEEQEITPSIFQNIGPSIVFLRLI